MNLIIPGFWGELPLCSRGSPSTGQVGDTLGHVKNMSVCHISQLRRRHRAARRLKGDGVFPVCGAIFLRQLLLWMQNSRVLTVLDIFGICSF